MNNTGTINNQSGSEIIISKGGNDVLFKKYLKNYGLINTHYNSIIRIYNENGLENFATINLNGIIRSDSYYGFNYKDGTITKTNNGNIVRVYFDDEEGSGVSSAVLFQIYLNQFGLRTPHTTINPYGYSSSGSSSQTNN